MDAFMKKMGLAIGSTLMIELHGYKGKASDVKLYHKDNEQKYTFGL